MMEYKGEPIVGSVWTWESYESEPTELRCVQINPKSVLFLREYAYPYGSEHIKRELVRKFGTVGGELYSTRDDAVNAKYELLVSRVESARELVVQREKELKNFVTKWVVGGSR